MSLRWSKVPQTSLRKEIFSDGGPLTSETAMHSSGLHVRRNRARARRSLSPRSVPASPKSPRGRQSALKASGPITERILRRLNLSLSEDTESEDERKPSPSPPSPRSPARTEISFENEKHLLKDVNAKALDLAERANSRVQEQSRTIEKLESENSRLADELERSKTLASKLRRDRETAKSVFKDIAREMEDMGEHEVHRSNHERKLQLEIEEMRASFEHSKERMAESLKLSRDSFESRYKNLEEENEKLKRLHRQQMEDLEGEMAMLKNKISARDVYKADSKSVHGANSNGTDIVTLKQKHKELDALGVLLQSINLQVAKMQVHAGDSNVSLQTVSRNYSATPLGEEISNRLTELASTYDHLVDQKDKDIRDLRRKVLEVASTYGHNEYINELGRSLEYAEARRAEAEHRAGLFETEASRRRGESPRSRRALSPSTVRTITDRFDVSEQHRIEVMIDELSTAKEDRQVVMHQLVQAEAIIEEKSQLIHSLEAKLADVRDRESIVQASVVDIELKSRSSRVNFDDQEPVSAERFYDLRRELARVSTLLVCAEEETDSARKKSKLLQLKLQQEQELVRELQRQNTEFKRTRFDAASKSIVEKKVRDQEEEYRREIEELRKKLAEVEKHPTKLESDLRAQLTKAKADLSYYMLRVDPGESCEALRSKVKEIQRALIQSGHEFVGVREDISKLGRIAEMAIQDLEAERVRSGMLESGMQHANFELGQVLHSYDK